MVVRGSADFADVVRRFSDTIWRACSLYFTERADVEDAFQDTFVKYASTTKEFSSDEHLKAWLIRVATNTCKDMLRSSARKTEPLEEAEETQETLRIVTEPAEDDGPDAQALLRALRKLPEQQRIALYLTYYEDLPATKVAEIMGTPTNTVYTYVSRGRIALKEVLAHER